MIGETLYTSNTYDTPRTELRNMYMVVKIISNYIEIFKVKAETANAAVIMAKKMEEPVAQFYSDEDQYGEGIFAIQIRSQSHEKFLHDGVDAIFHAKGDLTLGESRICH